MCVGIPSLFSRPRNDFIDVFYLLLLPVSRVPIDPPDRQNEALCDRSRSPRGCPRSPRRIGRRQVQREFEFVTEPTTPTTADGPFAPRARQGRGTSICGAQSIPADCSSNGRKVTSIGGHEEGKTPSDPLPGSLSTYEESLRVCTHELWCITLRCT